MEVCLGLLKEFPRYQQCLFHVPSQKSCIALGGCVNSKLVTVRFVSGAVLSIRMAELVKDEVSLCHHCGGEELPSRDGVCKTCQGVVCPVCGECSCGT